MLGVALAAVTASACGSGSEPPVLLGPETPIEPEVTVPRDDPSADCTHWVDPAGDDSGPGTSPRPWASLAHAVATVPDDECQVWFAPGLYEGRQALKRRFATETLFISAERYGAVIEHAGTVVDIDGGRNITIEGFELRQTPSTDDGFVVIVDRRRDLWSENITLRDNLIHDSFDDDLLKIHNGVRGAVVEGNIFFNQRGREQHIDINGVVDVEVRDNIFFNNLDPGDGTEAMHFIVVKDSGGPVDGILGARQIAIHRNVFLNWQGGTHAFVKVGNDGKPYHEAVDVEIVNNLMIGNSPTRAHTPFGIDSARDVTFVNNTVIGDLPSRKFGFDIDTHGANPPNENIVAANNIWADPTATMGVVSGGDPEVTVGLQVQSNLYWNGGRSVDAGELFELSDDPAAVLGDPRLTGDHTDLVLPRWERDHFASGRRTIRGEFVRLVENYGRPRADSAALDRAAPAWLPDDDILGRRRDSPGDIGAYER